MRPKVVATVAEKGGCGKSTLTVQMATYFGANGARVLAVDLDKQGNLSHFFLGEHKCYALPQAKTIAAVVDDAFDPLPEQVIHPTRFDNVSVLPSHKFLQQFTLPEQYWRDENSTSLRDFIDELDGLFEVVLIDTHPDLDTLPTWVALRAADFAFTPVEPSRFSAHSTVAAEQRIKQAQQVNPSLRFLGFVVNKYNAMRKKKHTQYAQELYDIHGEKMFHGVIGNYAEIEGATDEGLSVEEYQSKSSGSGQLHAFTIQLLERMTAAQQTEEYGTAKVASSLGR